jgi:hypothetical protein
MVAIARTCNTHDIMRKNVEGKEEEGERREYGLGREE